MTFAYLLEELSKNAYLELPIDITRGECESAAETFLNFLSLPLEVKERYYFKVDEGSHRTNVGYVRRHKDTGNADNKEYFHYHALSLEKFSGLMEADDERARHFLIAAENIFQKASAALRGLLSIFEEGVPGITATFFESHDFPSLYLRFLKYDVKDAGDFLARGHYDTGAITLALAESAPGLRIGKNDKDIKEVPSRDSGSALFMPAMRLRDLSPALAGVSPAWHDVVQKSADTYSDTVARWAIVFFADPSHINRLSTEEAHTPTY